MGILHGMDNKKEFNEGGKEMRTMQSKFWNVPVSEYLLSGALLDFPAFEKSPRRAATKMAIEKRRKVCK